MKMRATWHKNKTRGLDEIAGAISFICWQIAAERARKMRDVDFAFHSHRHQMDVVSEFLAFLAHCVDRRMLPQFTESERQQFIMKLANKLADIVDDNRKDVQGPGQYKQAMIDLFNQRFGEYATLPFDDDQPTFSVYRFLASNIQNIVDENDKQGALEQVMEVEGPNATDLLNKALNQLMPE